MFAAQCHQLIGQPQAHLKRFLAILSSSIFTVTPALQHAGQVPLPLITSQCVLSVSFSVQQLQYVAQTIQNSSLASTGL